MPSNFAIAVHGGAGTISRALMSPERERAYHQALEQVVQAGFEVLRHGGLALDAVEVAVRLLEDCPLFNAGRGSVFTHEGRHEMDAAIMDGRNRSAGAVAGVRNIQNPISTARRIMEHSDHVLLAWPGAEDFAREQGQAFQPDGYFFEQSRFDQLQEARITNTVQLDHGSQPIKVKKLGTAGAVARDQHGNLAAATSTGGMTNKRYSRIGDSPLIGAGTFADNHTCAISCTGNGEYFIRAVAAYDVACLMEYRGLSLEEACRIVVHDKLAPVGGEGGLIAVDAAGNLALPFNSEGMYRGTQTADSPLVTSIYKE
ncbi:isoaspartyl peptidase/L-asparaginase [Hymenobacter sp. BT175]|uniref:isoaspartyl peptidase/L-asparaginase family protein n=1 Tax=Hymenobacter translucens TaxID=2886507 RepID=UPI001D0F16BE|nr:isoaspartyl peptidase/L-asparaginase [Hymenobacter translucens]MCC2546322.1 isoaspartyl peptidase/L-asparaginase [Hymenobacter translucens]